MKLQELFESSLQIGTTQAGVPVIAQTMPSRGTGFGPSNGPTYQFRIGNKSISIDTTDIDWEGEEEDVWETVMSDVLSQTRNREVAEIIANFVIDSFT